MRFRFPQASLTITLALVILFFAANRGAYQGYFSDDDLDNLAATLLAGLDTFWRGFLSPIYDSFNFRPTGHVTYRWMGQIWYLQFPAYVFLIQLLHLLNTTLLYRLTRRLLAEKAALIAAAFFLFHPALLAAHWKPMYLFDVLCAMALLSSYLLYRQGRWILSLLLFWCAYKAKEVAILFPLVLLLEEYGNQRRWLRLAPFFAISLNFGLQALVANQSRPASAYSLLFSAGAVATCLRFYLVASLGLPWLSLAAWRWLTAEQRRWMLFGSLAALILLGPLLLLPGRLFAVYLYVPLIFGALAVGAVASRVNPKVLAALFLAYGAFGLQELRKFRRAELTQAQATQEFVASACAVLKDQRSLTQAFYEGGPAGLNSWGVEAAIRLCSHNLPLKLQPLELARVRPNDPVIRWTKMPGQPGRVEVTRFHGELAGDWFAWESSYRWMGERASLIIPAKAGHRRLLLDLTSAPADLLEIRVDGKLIFRQSFTNHGPQQVMADLLASLAQDQDLTIHLLAQPVRRIGGDPRNLALAVRAVRTLP
ncbi:MAG: hypothetical protein K2X03_21110 [Bryobacteraceae bacterium]|nr:hypothetical protein [Bryobacteraceae bacterium]